MPLVEGVVAVGGFAGQRAHRYTAGAAGAIAPCRPRRHIADRWEEAGAIRLLPLPTPCHAGINGNARRAA